MVRRLACLLFFLTYFACLGWAQTGTLEGKVTDVEGEPIPETTVELEGTRISTITNLAGEYRILDIPTGTYTLRTSANSYLVQTARITVARGQTVTQDFILQFDLHTAEEIVVTGTTTPERQIESSTSISSLTVEEINDAAPRSTTEFLRRIPGFTRVESSGGEVNQNLSVRGLLGVTSVSFEEDGIPVYPTMDVLFMNADNLFRLDENLEEIEVLRSGASPIFGSSTAGAVVNLLNKTGGSELQGTVKGTAGTSGLGRFDFNLNGPLSDDWRFNVGGFYRYDQGVRDPGYTGTSGGQLKANLTRLLRNGFFRISFKYIDDENLFITPLPFQNPSDPDYVEGFSEKGSFYSSEGVNREIPLPGNKVLKLPLDDGIKTKGTWVTGQVNLNLGRDWEFENISRVMSVDHTWNSLLSFDLLKATDYAEQNFPGIPYQLLFTNHLDVSGNKLPFDSQNGLIRYGAQWYIEKPIWDFSNVITIRKRFGSHDFSFGTYFTYYDQRNVWYFTEMLTDVRDNPRFLDLKLIQPDGSTLDVTKNGFLSFLNFYQNADGNTTVISFFTSDEFKVTDRLRIDLGARYELGKYNQLIEDLGFFDLDGNNRTPYDFEVFGNGTFRESQSDIYDVAFSAGLNYQLHPKHLAIYGSFTRGFKLPALDDFLIVFRQEEIEDLKPYRTDMFEAGVKYSAPSLVFSTALFYGRVYSFILHFVDFDPTIGPFFGSDPIPDTDSWGVEFEVLTRPTKKLELHSSGTFVSVDAPEISHASGQFYDGFTLAVTDFEASYLLYRNTRLLFDWHFVGERYSDFGFNFPLPSYSYINLGASYRFPEAGFTIAVRVLNLTQSKGLEEGNPLGRTPETNLFLARPILPRRITLEAKYDF